MTQDKHTKTAARVAEKNAPVAIRVAVALWCTALAAGMAETVLGAAGELSDPNSGMGILPVTLIIGVRLLVTVVFGCIVVALLHGRGWSRVVLAVLLGGIGTATLIYGPITQLVQGEPLATALGISDAESLVFFLVRALHLTAVLGALVTMFLPSATRFLRNNER
ncbi:hypothetical protein FHX37_1567 [Haloactinospora alba]|uniref:Uncharacterized protein n=1 Tax=Haloactinospora alba TaxID=405555 RepID=A0A543NIS0_9ACTN|nr:hypothetical protein [Haloactinospora alba]TQN31650.1 hypothetical protein FHX37_1567 [Haloactinospora alba]